jgi:hypothetical protein
MLDVEQGLERAVFEMRMVAEPTKKTFLGRPARERGIRILF